jgi:hypothetical protein
MFWGVKIIGKCLIFQSREFGLFFKNGLLDATEKAKQESR